MQNKQKNKLQIIGVALVIVSILGMFASIKKTPDPDKTADGSNGADKVTVENKVSNKVAGGSEIIEQHESITHEKAGRDVDSYNAAVYNQATKRAEDYLDASAFSYSSLIEQLEYEGFTHEQAVFGVDSCNPDWYEQATKRAKDYLAALPFSYSSLIRQLEYEGFTHKQAVFGVDSCNPDWYEQAAKQAEFQLKNSSVSYSRDDLIQLLQSVGFTYEQAVFGVEANGY